MLHNHAETLIAHVEPKITDGATYTRLAGELAKEIHIPPFSSSELADALAGTQIGFKQGWTDAANPDDPNFEVTFVTRS